MHKLRVAGKLVQRIYDMLDVYACGHCKHLLLFRDMDNRLNRAIFAL